ncbi:hypothetical protein [Sphingomonas sp. Leaf257]|uniref:hypothetical protein n=1 Tax=Sphingomonas sp. Leaf257 TaxID=1736309 RepID=UPI000A8756D9|nr:hypothetical protein [Sphingomonas sp. Leaf257]
MKIEDNRISHAVGGALPYKPLGRIAPGESVGRPQRDTGHFPATGSGVWSAPYPIMPCGGMVWGIADGVVHFSPVLPKGVSADAAAFIYGIMSWVFYAPEGATIFSVEKTVGDSPLSWLNVFTSTKEDWAALDALYARLMKAADVQAEVMAVCDEVRA